MSLYTRTVSVTLTESSLTLGVTVYSLTDAVLVTRITTVVESPSMTYTVQIPNFDTTWSGSIIFDSAGTIKSTTNFTGTGEVAPDITVPEFFPNTVSYISVYDAGLYFDTRLNTQAWDNASDSDKIKGLAQATRSIDRLNFKGVKVSATQQFQWPRILGPRNSSSTGSIPQDIQMAVCELALSLLDGVDQDLEDQLIGSMSSAYATVRVTSDPKIGRDHVKAGIVSITAWRLLLPWLQNSREITIRKG